MIPPEKHLAYAAGYLALNLTGEARAELAALPPAALATPEAMTVRMEIAMADASWDEVVPIASALAAQDAKNERPWVAWAYALRELGQIEEARDILLTGARLISRPGVVVDYNLACYACLLGELDEARRLLAAVFARDKSWRTAARADPDLAALYPAPPSA